MPCAHFLVSSPNMSGMKFITMPFALNPKPIVIKTFFFGSFHFFCQPIAFNGSHLNFCFIYFLSFVNQAFCIRTCFFHFGSPYYWRDYRFSSNVCGFFCASKSTRSEMSKTTELFGFFQHWWFLLMYVVFSNIGGFLWCLHVFFCPSKNTKKDLETRLPSCL